MVLISDMTSTFLFSLTFMHFIISQYFLNCFYFHFFLSIIPVYVPLKFYFSGKKHPLEALSAFISPYPHPPLSHQPSVCPPSPPTQSSIINIFCPAYPPPPLHMSKLPQPCLSNFTPQFFNLSCSSDMLISNSVYSGHS